MHIDPAINRVVLLVACLIASPLLCAFEHGSERICEPSADGEQFVCRDASAAKSEPAAQATATEPAAEPVAEIEAAPADSEPTVADTDPSPPSKLPNYLLHNPGSAPARAAPPASAQAPAPMPAPLPETVAAPEPVATSTIAQPTSAPPVRPAQPAVKAAPAASSTPEPAAATAAIPAATPSEIPANAAPKPTAVAPSRPVQASAPPPARTQTTTPAPRPDTRASSNPGAQRAFSSASEFKALPGNRYTIVLDSARSAVELDALVAALEDVPGKLYLLGLDMPDGRWFSLCWSDFDNLEEARVARASLPVDAPIASGWPRRISLLQSEIK